MIKMQRMTKEEKNLLDSYEKRKWKSVKNLKTEINRYQKIAQATPLLISSILHKYATGRLA
jgi:hypothetical protein